MSDEQLSGWANNIGLRQTCRLRSMATIMTTRPSKHGWRKRALPTFTRSNALQESHRLQRLAHFEQLVSSAADPTSCSRANPLPPLQPESGR
ncbi:hypothetical protein ACVXG7_17415 [Enterobacter hormaechei]